MRKSVFESIVSFLQSQSDVRVLDDYQRFDDEKIKSCDVVLFEFKQLNMSDNKARTYNKRFSIKAKTLVCNQTVAQYISDTDDIQIKRHYVASSKNYADISVCIDDYERFCNMFSIVRNAHYESIAQALENAFEIEVKTNASKKSRKAKKNA